MMQRWLLFVAIVAGVLAIDQVTKTWVIQNLALGQSIQPIEAAYPYFQITHSYNTGASFGFLAGTDFAGPMFLIIAVLVSIGMTWHYAQLPEHQWLMRLGVTLVIGGALGNAIDRVQHGHVVDFIHYQLPNVISNVSNVADHAIVGGVILMIALTWRDMPQDEETADDVRE